MDKFRIIRIKIAEGKYETIVTNLWDNEFSADDMDKTGICSTAGIGTNLYLAKIAMDIVAKHVPEHIGILTEELYRKYLWKHQPLTDFWNVGRGTAARLAKYGVYDMQGITELA